MRRRTMLAPMRPRPIIASCMAGVSHARVGHKRPGGPPAHPGGSNVRCDRVTDATQRSAGMQMIGIDVGGSGIKAAVVETTTGELTTPRIRVETPHHSTPKAVAK